GVLNRLLRKNKSMFLYAKALIRKGAALLIREVAVSQQATSRFLHIAYKFPKFVSGKRSKTKQCYFRGIRMYWWRPGVTKPVGVAWQALFLRLRSFSPEISGTSCSPIPSSCLPCNARNFALLSKQMR